MDQVIARETRARPGWIALLVGLVPSAALVIHARSYLPLVYDDAYISIRYAQRLLQGKGLTWTDGEAVEGYSNLLWVLSSAALGALGIDLVDSLRILGVLSALATIGALTYAFAPRTWKESLPAFAAGMFIALAAPIAIWAVAGLEGCMVAALLAWSIALLRPLLDGVSVTWRSVLAPGIPLALLCLTRPDAPLIVIAIGGFLFLRSPSRRGVLSALGVGVLPGLATLGQVAFRLAYYGDWLPNTAHAKVAVTAMRFQVGMACLEGAATHSVALWVPASLAFYVAWRDESRRSRISLAAALLIVWTFYSVTISCGEVGYRMLIPSIVLLAYLVAEALEWLMQRGRVTVGLAWIVVPILLASFGHAQQRDPTNQLARQYIPKVTPKAATIGTLLKHAFKAKDPLLAVNTAGAMPYFSELRSLDMLGLNDAHIARRRPTTFGRRHQGHELGDGAYVLSREPDIIVAGNLGGETFQYPGGQQLSRDPRFERDYRLVWFFADDPIPLHFALYCRLEGPIGVERAETELRIPGFWFANSTSTIARLKGDILGTTFPQFAPGTLTQVLLPAGVWRIAAEGSGAMRVSVRRQGQAETAANPDGTVEVHLDAPEAVDLVVRGDPKSFLTAVVAQRPSS